MRKFAFLFAVTVLSAGSLFAQNMAAVTVRHIKTEAIAVSQLNTNISGLEAQNGRTLTQSEKKTVLERMIDNLLLVQEAEADRSITATPEEIKQAAMGLLSQQLQMSGDIPPGAQITDQAMYLQIAGQIGMNIPEFEETVKDQILVEKLIAAREAQALQNIPPATQDELSEQYQLRIQEFVMSDSVWFNQIFFSTQGLSAADARAKSEKAREVYRQLMNTPATFPELVANESEDQQSRSRGGLTGPLMKVDPMANQFFGAEFINKVFSMNVGDVSEPLQSNSGYHIVQITRKESAHLLPMDDAEVSQYLQRVVYATKFQTAFEEARERVAAGIRETASIRYIGEYENW